MPSRKRPAKSSSLSKIKDLNQADLCLRKIGEIQSQLDEIDSETAAKITKIKDEAASTGKHLRKALLDLEQSLLSYAEYNKDDLFTNKRSVKLVYGRLAFHRSIKIYIKKQPEEKSTLYLLKVIFDGEGIRIKEEVNKDELKEWSAGKLSQVGAKREEHDNFSYELDRETVNEALLAVGE